jgi:hypothetical protein
MVSARIVNRLKVLPLDPEKGTIRSLVGFFLQNAVVGANSLQEGHL